MKILYVSTLSSTIDAFMKPHIEMLLKLGHNVDIACNINHEISNALLEQGCKVFNIGFQRSPLKLQNLSAYKKLKRIIKKGKYDIVHTHTPVASVCTRLACKNLKNVKVFYTAHGFHFFKGAPFKNWVIYYPIEKWMANYTDVIITINNEDYKRAKKNLKRTKVEYIPGVGLDTKKFSDVIVDKHKKRNELGIPTEAFVVLSVGELNQNKNHATIIKAISKLNNPNIYYVICGIGNFKNNLIDTAKELGIKNQVILLGKRNDIAEICKISDIFAFPSKREGLGKAALEAMASGLPIVTSNIHGIKDYSKDGISGFTNASTDIKGFAKSIEKLYTSPELRESMGENNIIAVEKFNLKYVTKELYKIYNIK